MGKPSDKNDKTQLLSDSMVLEVKPKEDKNDRSVWKGLVVGADEFAPPAPAKSSRGRWVVLTAVLLAGLGAAAYWFLGKTTPAAAHTPDAAVVPAVVVPADVASLPDAPPPDAAPDAAPPDAAAPEDAAVPVDAAVVHHPAPKQKVNLKRPTKKKPLIQYKTKKPPAKQ